MSGQKIYQNLIPSDITTLKTYYVSGQLFICTCIVMGLMVIFYCCNAMMSIIRSLNGFVNIEYIAGYEAHYQAAGKINNLVSGEDLQSMADKQFKKKCHHYSRLQSRILQFSCLIVVIAINIGTYTCTIMQTVCFFASIAFYLLFNVFFQKKVEKVWKGLKSIWFIPLLACYIPYFVFPKSLIVS